MKRALVVIAAMALACGCASEPREIGEPLAPGATGTIILSVPGASQFQSLEVRSFPDPVEGFARQIPYGAETQQASFAASTVSFPFSYRIGADHLGGTATQRWRAVAWLAGAAGATQIQAGEAWGTATYEIGECHVGGDRCQPACYCGVAANPVEIDLSSTSP
jgi:hypothetical protein